MTTLEMLDRVEAALLFLREERARLALQVRALADQQVPTRRPARAKKKAAKKRAVQTTHKKIEAPPAVPAGEANAEPKPPKMRRALGTGLAQLRGGARPPQSS